MRLNIDKNARVRFCVRYCVRCCANCTAKICKITLLKKITVYFFQNTVYNTNRCVYREEYIRLSRIRERASSAARALCEQRLECTCQHALSTDKFISVSACELPSLSGFRVINSEWNRGFFRLRRFVKFCKTADFLHIFNTCARLAPLVRGAVTER